MKRRWLVIRIGLCVCQLQLWMNVLAREIQANTNDLLVISEKSQNKALDSLAQYKGRCFSPGELVDDKYEELRQNVDILYRRFVPRYLCKAACVPDGENVLVLFETEALDEQLWSLNILSRNNLKSDRFGGLSRFVCGSYYDVVGCGVTNCFGSPIEDTLYITTVPGYSRGQEGNSRKVFFTACSGYDAPLLTHIEMPDGRPLYYCLPAADPASTHTYLMSQMRRHLPASEKEIEMSFKNGTAPEILTRFMILNSPLEGFPEDHFLLQLRKSESFTQIVGSLLKHPHPWVRAAANHYLIHNSTLGRPQKVSEKTVNSNE